MAGARRRSAISFFRWTTFRSRRYDRSKFELEIEMHPTAATAPRGGFFALVLFLLMMGACPASHAANVWEAHSGDPCCGVPDDSYKFLDANEACVKTFPLGQSYGYWLNPRNMRNSRGAQLSGECLYDTTCGSSDCGYLPDYPNGGNILILYSGSTGSRAQNCGVVREFLGMCGDLPPKNNGKPCPSCGNPVNAGTGNKFQS